MPLDAAQIRPVILIASLFRCTAMLGLEADPMLEGYLTMTSEAVGWNAGDM